MNLQEESQKLELERLRKQNEQIDIEIAFRKVELSLLKKELTKSNNNRGLRAASDNKT